MDTQTIQIVLPVALQEVFDDLAPEFMGETGHLFDVSSMLNPEVPGHIATGAPWSIALSNPTYIQTIVETGACRGGVQRLGYSPLCFAMRGTGDGAPIQRADGIAAILRQASTIATTQGGTSSAQFSRLMEHLDLSQDLTKKIRPMPGGGPAAAVRGGQVDVALLPLSNVAPVADLYAKAICPRDLDVQVDLAICVADGANAATTDFAQWLLNRERKRRLHALGVWQDP